jgi:hypothetical protein
MACFIHVATWCLFLFLSLYRYELEKGGWIWEFIWNVGSMEKKWNDFKTLLTVPVFFSSIILHAFEVSEIITVVGLRDEVAIGAWRHVNCSTSR